MAINYKTIQAGGTTTDLDVSVVGLKLLFEMTKYQSGIHYLNRSGDSVKEEVELPVLTSDAKVSIYLEDAPETVILEGGISITKNEGAFVIDVCRTDIDKPYNPKDLIMYVGSFDLPAGTKDLNDCKIDIIKVV